MADLVPADQIERIVGRERHPNAHYGRVVTAENKVYILHSKRCLATGRDLRECVYSKALDRGTVPGWWSGLEERPVPVTVWAGRLAPSSVPEVDR